MMEVPAVMLLLLPITVMGVGKLQLCALQLIAANLPCVGLSIISGLEYWNEVFFFKFGGCSLLTIGKQ